VSRGGSRPPECSPSLNITQFQGVSPVQNVDSIKVSLLATPALGCTQPMSEHWKP
jgi:hypothetical protein